MTRGWRRSPRRAGPWRRAPDPSGITRGIASARCGTGRGGLGVPGGVRPAAVAARRAGHHAATDPVDDRLDQTGLATGGAPRPEACPDRKSPDRQQADAATTRPRTSRSRSGHAAMTRH